MEYVKKAASYALIIFLGVLYIGAVIGGSIQFWLWATDGSWVGFVLAVATWLSLLGGPIVAAHKDAP